MRQSVREGDDDNEVNAGTMEEGDDDEGVRV